MSGGRKTNDPTPLDIAMDRVIDLDAVLQRANELYAAAKLPGVELGFRAPETLPRIQSDQVRSVVRALVEAINGAVGARV